MKSIGRLACLSLLILTLAGPGFGGLGVKAGVNLASQRQGGFTMQGSQLKLLAGLFLPIKINGMFTLQPELLFIQKGSEKETASMFGGAYTVGTKLNCLDFILLSKITVGRWGNFEPQVLFGPYLSYRLSGKYIYNDGAVEETIEDYHSLEYGYTLGAGTDLHLLGRTFALEARFSHSLTDVHNTPTPIWNKGFSITAGFYF